MKHQTILGITLHPQSKEKILEQIILFTRNPKDFLHIVSINPENVIISQQNEKFKKVLNYAQIQIVDGVGILLAGAILGIDINIRITGVDLMKDILDLCKKEPLRVMFLGAKHDLANKLAECYRQKYPNAKFYGLEGFKNIQNPTKSEEDHIFSIVSEMRPHILFAAFGSPAQELWFERNRASLQGIVCMGVGGGFDFISGKISRAPLFLRRVGLEWFYRLVIEPWRWKRQLRILTFLYLVLKQKLQKVY